MTTRHKFTTRQLFSVGFFGLAAILLVVGVFSAVGTAAFLSNAVSTRGEVVDVQTVHNPAPLTDPESGAIHYPEIRFATSGAEYRFVANHGTHTRRFEVGDEVEILYPAENPTNARLADTMGLWGRALVLGGTGLLFGLIGLVYVKGFGAAKKNGGRRSARRGGRAF